VLFATHCIGIGNIYRHDDGVGLYVARRLRLEALANVSIMENDGDGGALLDAFDGAKVIVLIDAIRSGAPAGTIHRLSLHDQPMPCVEFSSSSHVFGVAEAVELARTLGQLPPSCVLYGVEAASFDWGVGLTPVVEKAAGQLVRQIAHTLWESQIEVLKGHLK